MHNSMPHDPIQGQGHETFIVRNFSIFKIYLTIEEFLQGIKGNSYVMALGDWNAVVGENQEDDCVGNYSIPIT